MYLEHFGLRESPFSITPDPRFVFLSERHRDALAHLLFGIGQGGSGGFVQLTGEVGTGKTTLCRLLLEQVPDNTRIALVLNPRLTPVELLETICEELHLPVDGRRGSVKALVDALNHYLLDAYAQGLRVVLIIDEAQDLSTDALEQLRLLTNLETDTQKLLQIILLGQPELRTLLARDDLRQLSQRITARFHLTPLDAVETEGYLRHRHAIAGGVHLPFSRRAIQRLHRHSGGVPRLINVIAERSLLAGYARDERVLEPRTVDLAAREALPATPSRRPSTAVTAIACAAIVVIALAAFALRPSRERRAVAPAAAVVRHPAARNVAGPVPHIDIPVVDAPSLEQAIATDAPSPLTGWQALLAAWNLPADAADATIAAQCAPDLAPGVHCLRGRATLDTLATIGRPVLLQLRAGNHGTSAELLGVDGVHARLRLGGGVLDVPRVTLQRAWNGDYAAVWRDDVQRPAAGASATPLDVRQFQASHGLAVDGMAGPQTRFAQSADGPGPRLLPRLD